MELTQNDIFTINNTINSPSNQFERAQKLPELKSKQKFWQSKFAVEKSHLIKTPKQLGHAGWMLDPHQGQGKPVPKMNSDHRL